MIGETLVRKPILGQKLILKPQNDEVTRGPSLRPHLSHQPYLSTHISLHHS